MNPKKNPKRKNKKIRRKLFGAAAVISAAVFVWSSLFERNLPVLRRETLPVLPPGSPDLKILHLSDLHLAPWQRRKMGWVRKLREENPDLIIATGDFIGHKRVLDELAYTLMPFAGIPGVYVYGSNDYYAPVFKNPVKYVMEPSRLSTRIPEIDTPALDRLLKDTLGFKNLNNAAFEYSLNDGATVLRFFGLGDPHIRYDDAREMFKAIEGLPDSTEKTVSIGVVHAPYRESLDNLLDAGAEAIFAGHTHGGQVRFPFVGAVTSNSDLDPKKARGLSVWHRRTRAAFLHVSAGLGTSVFAPVRFLCRPEASIITLKSS